MSKIHPYEFFLSLMIIHILTAETRNEMTALNTVTLNSIVPLSTINKTNTDITKSIAAHLKKNSI